MINTVDQLAAALVANAGAVPETAALLAKIVIDASPNGDRRESVELAKSAYPSLFLDRTPLTEAEGRGDEPASHMPVTMRVLREARGG